MSRKLTHLDLITDAEFFFFEERSSIVHEPHINADSILMYAS